MISSLAAALIARLRSIAVTFVAAIVVGVVHDLLTPFTALTNYRDLTPFVLAVIALLVVSRQPGHDAIPRGGIVRRPPCGKRMRRRIAPLLSRPR